MKRLELIRHLKKHGCEMMREGGSHTIYVHWVTKKTSTIPRHNEIKKYLAEKICKDLGIPKM